MPDDWHEFPTDQPANDPSQDELNGQRIRQLAALRRAAYRSRSYCLIALAASAVSAIQLIVNAVHRFQTHQSPLRPLLYLLAAIALLTAATFFARLALRFHREATPRIISPTPTHPDFSNLSDGTQRVRNLEEL